jgi:hypothetical protein
VEVENVGEGPTLVTDANHLQLVATRGIFDNVALGGFAKYDLRDAATNRRRPAADTLFLYVPLLAPGDVVTSGPIELRGGRTVDDVSVGGSFQGPDGNEVAPQLVQLDGEDG